MERDRVLRYRQLLAGFLVTAFAHLTDASAHLKAGSPHAAVPAHIRGTLQKLY